MVLSSAPDELWFFNEVVTPPPFDINQRYELHLEYFFKLLKSCFNSLVKKSVSYVDTLYTAKIWYKEEW